MSDSTQTETSTSSKRVTNHLAPNPRYNPCSPFRPLVIKPVERPPVKNTFVAKPRPLVIKPVERPSVKNTFVAIGIRV